jgi:hypothetical protein
MIMHTKEQLHIFMHAKKIKYKYLSMKKVSIYIFLVGMQVELTVVT